MDTAFKEMAMKYINYLKSFTRYTVPEQHYRAWKVLILNTREYGSQVQQIIVNHSYELWLNENSVIK